MEEAQPGLKRLHSRALEVPIVQKPLDWVIFFNSLSPVSSRADKEEPVGVSQTIIIRDARSPCLGSTLRNVYKPERPCIHIDYPRRRTRCLNPIFQLYGSGTPVESATKPWISNKAQIYTMSANVRSICIANDFTTHISTPT
jgi:hypothetical protein